MIYPTFYNSNNVVSVYLAGNIRHYMQKDLVTVVKQYSYRLDYGENMYTLAVKVFGYSNEHLWPIIAEINELRYPDDWNEGDVVNLPEVIVLDNSINQIETLPQNGRSFTTVL